MPLPSPKILVNDLKIALNLLTRLPVPAADWSDKDRPSAQAAWAYPIVGLVVAALATVLAMVALWLGVPAPVAALIFIASLVMSTGAMHEDGLADCADGFWGGWEKARRLEIMKDSAIGTYGVLALILVSAARWTLYTQLLAGGAVWAMLLAPVVSRAAMVQVMATLPNARDGGLSADTGRPEQEVMFAALSIAAIAALLVTGLSAIWVLATATLAVFALRQLAKLKIDGQTGDVLGATQQVTEAAVLIALVATL